MQSNMDMSKVDSHPYDTPWAIVKDLRTQIHDLRAAFQSEQQQRASEVTELRNEVAALKDALGKEKHTRHESCTTIINDLHILDTNCQKGIEEVKLSVKQTMHQLHQILQDEIRDRKATESHRDTREAAMKCELQTHKTACDSEMGSHRNEHVRVKDEFASRINDLMHDMGLVVDYLQKVSGSWDMLKGATLRSVDKSGQNSGNPYNTTSPYAYLNQHENNQ